MFNKLKNWADNYLSENVGRSYYQEVAEKIKLLKRIKDPKIREDVEVWFNSILVRYKKRPALRDELGKVGIRL